MGKNLAHYALQVNGCKGNTKFVLVALADCANDMTGECYPSQNTIAAVTGLSRSTVGDAIESLENIGYITKCHRLGSSNIYTLAIGCWEIRQGVSGNRAGDVGKSGTNNKSIESLYKNKTIQHNPSLGGKMTQMTQNDSKTQEGSLEGEGGEGSKPKAMSRGWELMPRDLEGIFAILRAEYKEEFPVAAQFVDITISIDNPVRGLPPELLKELKDMESKDWPGIVYPLKWVRKRVRCYVLYTLKGDLKLEFDAYMNDVAIAKKYIESAYPSQIPRDEKMMAEARNKIDEIIKCISEIEEKIVDVQEGAARRRQAAAGAVIMGRDQASGFGPQSRPRQMTRVVYHPQSGMQKGGFLRGQGSRCELAAVSPC